MKPQATGIRKSSTFDGQQIAMSIDTNSLSHIMSVLTNLYSDPEMAVLREYSCNARDSHLASGNDEPIRVTLPSPLNHFLTIQDFGVGLSIDDITAIYSRYGASTKRDTNEQTGMLGLGSKSALTYAPQFTLTAVKDGVKSEVLISVKVDGAGTMTVMDTVATDERNGVTITIPTEPKNNLAEKATKLYSLWDEGSVLVNGEQPERIQGIVVGDAIITEHKRAYYNHSDYSNLVVMGGVPYPLSSDMNNKLGRFINNYCVFFVPMGAVDFVPSREELHFTGRTNTYLNQMIDDFQKQVGQTVSAEIANATTKPEALAIATKWRQVGDFENTRSSSGHNPFRFRGETIPTRFQGAHFHYNPNASGTRKTSRATWIDDSHLADSVFVYDYEADSSPSSITRERVAQYLANNGLKQRKHLFFAPKDFVGGWSTAVTVDYATIKATKLPKVTTVANGGSKTPYVASTSWDVVEASGKCVSTQFSDISGDVVIFSPTDLNKDIYRWDARAALFAILAPNQTLVEVPKNSQDRFRREYQGGNVNDAIQVVADWSNEKLAKSSDRERAIHHYQTNADMGALAKATDKLSQINDTKLRQEIADLRKIQGEQTQIVNKVNQVRRTLNLAKTDLGGSDYQLALSNYPLFANYCSLPFFDAIVEYANVLHEHKSLS